MTTVKEIIAEMGGATPTDTAFVEKAYEYSKKAHEGQVRYSGEPYFVHAAATAKILAEYGMDATTIAAGLLHDAVEDGRVSREEMEKEFGNAFPTSALADLDRYEAVVKLLENGTNLEPFQAKMLPLMENRIGRKHKLVDRSRERFATPRAEIEVKMKKWLI